MIINDLPKTTKGGIYAIINASDLKIYIGSTSNLKARARQHNKALIKGIHYNKALQADADKLLRFVVLYEDARGYGEEVLKSLEYLYMDAALQDSFTLYNRIPYKRNSESLCEYAALMLMGTFQVRNNFIKSIDKEYNSKPFYWSQTRQDRRPDFFMP